MELLNFDIFFGSSEESYSKIIAQTIVFSEKFRKSFIKLINTKHDNKDIKNLLNNKIDINNIVLEYDFEALGRIDIFIELEDSLNIGIENKKWAKLQYDQLKRYNDALEKKNTPYVLIFLSPENYYLNNSDKPINLSKGVFVEVNYKEILNICQHISNKTKNSLEKNYFNSLINFIKEVTMEPFNLDEIKSLTTFYKARRKMINILNNIKRNDENIEETANYMLCRREINKFICYFGFRYGTDWYYNVPLLNENAEMIIFVKDVEKDEKIAKENNERLKNINNKFIKEEVYKGIDSKYFERKTYNECRFAFRKSLKEYENKDVGSCIKWFQDIMGILEKELCNN